MKIIYFSLLFFGLQLSHGDPGINKEEARTAAVYLNQLRADPQKFSAKFNFLKELSPAMALRWNDTLARVAEARAMDMAKRNYFGHVDPDGYGANYYMNKAGYKLEPAWIKEKSANYFESLNAGGFSGIEAIESLILDSNTPSLGHRKHLLGMTEWNASLVDIGIGFVNGNGTTAYPTYTCVLIAKHNW